MDNLYCALKYTIYKSENIILNSILPPYMNINISMHKRNELWNIVNIILRSNLPLSYRLLSKILQMHICESHLAMYTFIFKFWRLETIISYWINFPSNNVIYFNYISLSILTYCNMNFIDFSWTTNDCSNSVICWAVIYIAILKLKSMFSLATIYYSNNAKNWFSPAVIMLTTVT